MKNIFILSSLFLFACNQSTETIEPTTDSEPLPIETKKDSILHFGNESFLVTDYSNEKLHQGIVSDERTEEPVALANDNKVTRNGEDLIFELTNGKKITLTNIPFDESDEMNTATYEFIGSVENSNYWEVFGMGYEYHWYILINKNTGEQIDISGKSTCSPNGKYILTANPDIEAGFTMNGFELYSVENDKLIHEGTCEIPDWAPYSVYWISDSEIVITAGKVNEESDNYEMMYSNILLTRIEEANQP